MATELAKESMRFRMATFNLRTEFVSFKFLFMLAITFYIGIYSGMPKLPMFVYLLYMFVYLRSQDNTYIYNFRSSYTNLKRCEANDLPVQSTNHNRQDKKQDTCKHDVVTFLFSSYFFSSVKVVVTFFL